MTGSSAAINISVKSAEEFRGKMLAWYDRHARIIPWRAQKGQKPDPYAVWLSEIMCQQTTVQAVVPYFLKFLEKWPRVEDLAAADREEIMRAWAGLGYYARARNLHQCAIVIANDYEGVFPDTKEGLGQLPGIGDYTSSAIAAIAFDRSETVVDGNVERIMARIFDVEAPVPRAKKDLKAAAFLFFKKAQRPGDFAQSLMDLGATICTPKSPKCMICPVVDFCAAKVAGTQESRPAREAKKPKPQRAGNVYWVENKAGDILLHRRPDKALLGGMLGLPTDDWREEGAAIPLSLVEKQDLQATGAHIRHVFTHFDLRLDLVKLEDARIEAPDGYFWQPRSLINPDDFPTVFKKAVLLCLAQN